ncbi:MAG: DUF445 family protein, partial [Candidatus Electrothrix sp. AR3]|nr:DUF445 family protein [Candidatus Electrothrix sp. AR3]
GREKLILPLSNELQSLKESEQASQLTTRVVSSIVDKAVARPVGILQGLIPMEVRRGMSDYLVQSVNRMLIREVPGLVESLRIRELVTNKVDSLDLLRLEGLLLSIMEEQFKYINLFGALLGFLIGLINLVVLHL